MLGFPIRTSSDPRSVGSSPRHIAASHVLHRLLMPRHPPCALKHLQHKKPEKEKKKLHIKHTQQHPNHRTPRKTRGTPAGAFLYARCSQPLSTNQTPHPTTKAGRQQQPSTPGKTRYSRPATPTTKGAGPAGPVVSKPNSVSGSQHPHKGKAPQCLLLHQTRLHYRGEPSNESPDTQLIPQFTGPAQVSWCSLERR